MFEEYVTEVHWMLLFISIFHVAFTPRVFTANFGVTPLICAHLWKVILQSKIPVQPRHLFYFLCFIKTYSTFDDLSIKFQVTEKTVRTNTWRVAHVLYRGLQTISLEDRLGCSPFQLGDLVFRLAIDATVCPIEKPKDNEVQRLFYSGKHKIHCLKYEVAVRADGVICWAAGPYQGSLADVECYRAERMEDTLSEGELILGDMGYIGEPRIITPKKRKPGTELTEDERLYNDLLGDQRVLVEHTFAFVKSFRCLSQSWRHDLPRHKIVFFVVCELVNLKKLLF